MDSVDLREIFFQVIKREFSNIYITAPFIKARRGERSSIKFSENAKRWIQIDANKKHLEIAMNHYAGDFTLEDISDLGFPIVKVHNSSFIRMRNNDDAINISIFNHEPYDFNNEKFIAFLHKHYQSYLKII